MKKSIQFLMVGLLVVFIIIFSIWTVQTISVKKQLAKLWERDLEECYTLDCTVDGMGNLGCRKVSTDNLFNMGNNFSLS